MSRVETDPGAKYSTHKGPAREYKMIAPVGTNCTSVDKVEMNAIGRPATTGFQTRYVYLTALRCVFDDHWGPAPVPAKPTSLQTATLQSV